jgi:hypothetical protein
MAVQLRSPFFWNEVLHPTDISTLEHMTTMLSHNVRQHPPSDAVLHSRRKETSPEQQTDTSYKHAEKQKK